MTGTLPVVSFFLLGTVYFLKLLQIYPLHTYTSFCSCFIHIPVAARGNIFPKFQPLFIFTQSPLGSPQRQEALALYTLFRLLGTTYRNEGDQSKQYRSPFRKCEGFGLRFIRQNSGFAVHYWFYQTAKFAIGFKYEKLHFMWRCLCEVFKRL